MASNGEFVFNAKQTAKHPELLEAINAGMKGYATGGYVVGGHQYGSLRSAQNAVASLTLRIDTTDMQRFDKALAGTAAQAHAAFQSMINDANKLDISKGLSKYLTAENTRLAKAINDRNRLAAQLKAVQAAFTQTRASVIQAGEGSFDLTTAGTAAGGPVTFGSVQAEASQALARVRQWGAGLKALGARGFSKTAEGRALLAQLGAKGPDDLPEIQALLQASPKARAGWCRRSRRSTRRRPRLAHTSRRACTGRR